MSEGPTPPPPPESTPPPAPPAAPAHGGHHRRRWCPCQRCRTRSLIGPAVMVTIGVIFLLDEFTRWSDFGKLWPLILLVIGVIKLIEYGASTEGHQG